MLSAWEAWSSRCATTSADRPVGDLVGRVLQRLGSGRARFGGGFVHDDDGRVEEQDPGQCQLLGGDGFQLETAGADHGVET